MRLMTFNKPRLYLRKDPDAGWTLALWKWRLFFQVVVGANRGSQPSVAPTLPPQPQA